MLPVMHQVFRLHRLHTDISHHLALAFVLWALKTHPLIGYAVAVGVTGK